MLSVPFSGKVRTGYISGSRAIMWPIIVCRDSQHVRRDHKHVNTRHVYSPVQAQILVLHCKTRKVAKIHH